MTFKLIIILMNLYSLGNSCENEIYCKGRLYELLQENITDEFLDKKVLVDPDKLLLSFRNLTKNINQEENFASFFHKNFGDEKEGVDYEMWNLPDKKLIEAKINNDRNLITFVNYLKELLLKMGLKGTELMRKHKKRYSLLSTTGFIQDHKDSKEASYWETYWVVNGLLFYEMYESTKGNKIN
nr:trehalase-like [Onthophagus taurus]